MSINAVQKQTVFRRLISIYLISSLLIAPWVPALGVWRQGSVSVGGDYDIDYDDINDNFQWDSDEPYYYVNSDTDNLTDVEERLLGTNIHNPDTDYDGLTDSDEVSGLQGGGWTSDPNNWDSDGDGYSDGDEFWGCYIVNYIALNAVGTSSPYFDWDADGIPNYQDAYIFDSQNITADYDNDGVIDGIDSDPLNSALWDDFNRNGINDSNEGGPMPVDTDGDGYDDASDSHPNDPLLWNDWNYNGINENQDSDNDSHPDENDSHPSNPNLWSDWNYNGINDDQDSDADGYPDEVDYYPFDPSIWAWNGSSEGGNNSNDVDGDGWPDGQDSHPTNQYLWNDWNGNGINDSEEPPPPPNDADGDGIPDESDPYPNDEFNGDHDQDGLLDALESGYGADPGMRDTDGDGLSDGEEVNETNTDPSLVDSDGDGLSDCEEVRIYAFQGFSPTNAHSLSAILDDWQMAKMVDSDGDGIPNEIELLWGLNPQNAVDGGGDLDGNGVTNLDQYLLGMAPNAGMTLFDGDGDGMTDAWEAINGLSAVNFDDAVSDADQDGVFAYEEYKLLLDPNDAITFENPVQVTGSTNTIVLSDWQRFYFTTEYYNSKTPPFTVSLFTGGGGFGTPFPGGGFGPYPGGGSGVPADQISVVFKWLEDNVPFMSSFYPAITSSVVTIYRHTKQLSWDSAGWTTWQMPYAVSIPPLQPVPGTVPSAFDAANVPGPAPASSNDWDGDGMPNIWEYRYKLTIRANDSKYDKDGDYLSNIKEYLAHSDPTIVSTDGDLLSDFWEKMLNYNPRLSDTDGNGTPDHLEDSDGDGINEADEVAAGSNPFIKDAGVVFLEVNAMITL